MFTRLSQRLRDGFLVSAFRLFRLRDSADRVARGFAIGVACCFLPTFGAGGFVAALGARLLGGSLVAGFVGGCALAFAWPLLFLLNLKVGGLFFRPEVVVDDVGDLTPTTIDAVLWGKTFAVGTLINASLAAALAYVLVRAAFPRVRPAALRSLRGCLRRRRLNADPAGNRKT